MTMYGHNLEKEALLGYWKTHDDRTCPVSGLPLSLRDVISNRSLEQQIIGWKKLNGVAEKKTRRKSQKTTVKDEDDDDDDEAILLTTSPRLSAKVSDKVVERVGLMAAMKQKELQAKKTLPKTTTTSSSSKQHNKPSRATKLIRSVMGTAAA